MIARSTDLPEKVGVVGGGRMGAGIAHAFLTAGCTVVVVDISQDAAQAARERIELSVEKSLAKGLEGDKETILQRLDTTADYRSLAGCSLVIEAVPEDFSLKARTFSTIAEHAPGAVIASNTSSLSISDLAETVDDPDRVVGLHFFNPVPASKLIEIVRARHTPEELVATAVGWVKALSKTPVVVRDCPGFASSRLGLAIALEAMRMVEEDVASAEDIDNAMVLGYKFPIGPLALTDLVGLDVRLGIAEYLHSTLGERFRPPEILRRKVAEGELGKKTGAGFYRYD